MALDGGSRVSAGVGERERGRWNLSALADLQRFEERCAVEGESAPKIASSRRLNRRSSAVKLS